MRIFGVFLLNQRNYLPIHPLISITKHLNDTKIASDIKPIFNASRLKRFCDNPTSIELYKFLIRDKRFSEKAQDMLPKLKELFQIYNNEMRQIKHRQLIMQQKQIKSNHLEEKFESKPLLEQIASDRKQNLKELVENDSFGKLFDSSFLNNSNRSLLNPIDSNMNISNENSLSNVVQSLTNVPVSLIDAATFKSTTLEKLNAVNESCLNNENQVKQNEKLINNKQINKCINDEWKKRFLDGSIEFDDQMIVEKVKEQLNESDLSYNFLDKQVKIKRGCMLETNLLKRVNAELKLNFSKQNKQKLKEYESFSLKGIVDGIDMKNSCIIEMKSRNDRKKKGSYLPMVSDQLQVLTYMDVYECKECVFVCCDPRGQLYFTFFRQDKDEFNIRIRNKLDRLVNECIRNITEKTFVNLVIEANATELSLVE